MTKREERTSPAARGRWWETPLSFGKMGFMILRCTKKMLDVIKPGHLADAPASTDDWYGNLLWADGRKCLLLAHAGTLFTIFEPDIRTAGLRRTGALLTSLIQRELAREQLPAGTFGSLDPGAVAVGKTADRRVLGCMNDQAFACEHAIGLDGGLAGADIADLNQWLRRRILGPLGAQYPIERAEELARQRDLGHGELLLGPGKSANDRRAGVSDRRLYRLRDSGEIIALGGGAYRWGDASPADDGLIEISERIPTATICLETALARHHLIDAVPVAIDIAVLRGSTRPRLRSPVRPHQFDPRTFEVGRELLDTGSRKTVGIYSAERSIIGMVRLRH
ncbi:MAG: type IV toxin-antitoxin system AbiEi family antitoxin domain-containing protein [Trebonia sp.]